MVVFVDLTKAFDRACREVVLGWPDGVDAAGGEDYLRQLGFPEHAVQHMYAEIVADGPIAAQQRMHPRAHAVLRSLHSGSWLQVGRRGRQT